MITDVTLNGHSIHADASSSLSHLRELPGGFFGSPPVRESTTPRPDDHGTVDQTRYYEPRVISLAVKIRAASYAALYDELKVVQQALRPGTLVELRWTLMDGSARRAWVRPSSDFVPTMVGNGVAQAYWDCQVVAPDPRVYGVTARTASLVPTGTATGGIMFPITFPLDFFGSSGPTVVVTNAGNAEAQPVFVFHGPWLGAWIRNVTTDETLRLRSDLNLFASDVVTVDTATGEVTLNGDSEPGVVDWQRSDVPHLVPGSNTFAAGGGFFAGSSVQITAYDAWI